MNTISKEMGPFLALSEWNEWINFHSKWVSYQCRHSIWVPFALNSHSIWAIFSSFNMGHLQHEHSLTTMCWELCFALSGRISRSPLPHRSCHKLTFVVRTMLSPVKYSDHEKIMLVDYINIITYLKSPSIWVYFRSNPFIMGTDNGGSIQYGYNFEILNTFEMGHLKKTCPHIPSRMDLSQTHGSITWFNICIYR